jgi:hypothetical protein
MSLRSLRIGDTLVIDTVPFADHREGNALPTGSKRDLDVARRGLTE